MLREVADIYRSSKKKKDINRFTEYVCRPPAALFVYLVRNTRITPNQVTFLSFLVAVAAGAMLVFGPGYGWLLGAAVVYEISFILDCADGQLARLRGTTSKVGHLLDFLMDEIKAMLIFGCVAVRLWRWPEGDWSWGALPSHQVYILVGIGALFCLASGISITSFVRRPEYGAPPPTAEGQPAVIQKRVGAIGSLISLLEWAARSVVHYPQYIWLAAALDRIDIYFWAYAGVNALYLAKAFLAILIRLGRFGPAREGDT